MSPRAFWVAVLVLWTMLIILELNRTSASVLLDVLPRSLGMLIGSLIPGFLLWGLGRAFGAYKEPSQRRAMVLAGAAVTLALMFFGTRFQ